MMGILEMVVLGAISQCFGHFSPTRRRSVVAPTVDSLPVYRASQSTTQGYYRLEFERS
jgi:hypothetical protein